MARTVDFDGEDGKWNSMVLDEQGNPHLTYSAFPEGLLRCAYWDGKNWVFQPGISASNKLYNVGMGNSLVRTPQKELELSFYEGPLQYGANGDRGSLKFAKQTGSTWSVETVDTVFQRGGWAGFRSSLVLDKRGFPHISYEDDGTLKHAYWDGTHWRIQVVVAREMESFLFNSMAIDQEDNLYIGYRDPHDGSLKVAVGRPLPEASTSPAAKQEKDR